MNKIVHKLTLSLIGIAIIFNLILLFTPVSADTEVIDTIELTVPIACTMGGVGTNSHNATINPGTYSGASGNEYENGIGKTTLTTFCNDANGFSIYAIGFTNDLYEGELHTKLVGQNTNQTISTKVYASGDTASNWSMKLTKVENPVSGNPVTYNPTNMTVTNSFNNWHVVPDTYTKVAEYHSSTTDPSTTDTTLGAKLETTYATFIASDQVADTYTGQVKYTLVHPYDAAEPLVCKPNGTTISTIKCMQDISSTNKSTILSSMAEDQQYTLRDKRDGKTYTVSKLKDGNIWMTQNLDLDLDSNTTYTNEDTDIGWNTSMSSYDTASWTPIRSTYASNVKTWCQGGIWDSQYEHCVYNYTPESYDAGDLYWNGTISNNNDWSTYKNSCTRNSITHEPTCDESLNPITTYTTISGNPTQEYHLGNYYNWTAAVAMNDSSTYTTQYQDANQSICPKGWTLPKSGNNTSNGSFQYLSEQYGWNSSNHQMTNPYIWNSAIKLPLAGYWGGLLIDVGDYGYFWSPIVINYSDFVYLVRATSDGILSVGYGGSRWGGSSLRCLTR